MLFFKKGTPAEAFSRKFFKIFDKNFFKEQFRVAASVTSEFVSTDENVFKVVNIATDILMSLLWYLGLLLYI